MSHWQSLALVLNFHPQNFPRHLATWIYEITTRLLTAASLGRTRWMLEWNYSTLQTFRLSEVPLKFHWSSNCLADFLSPGPITRLNPLTKTNFNKMNFTALPCLSSEFGIWNNLRYRIVCASSPPARIQISFFWLNEILTIKFENKVREFKFQTLWISELVLRLLAWSKNSLR